MRAAIAADAGLAPEGLFERYGSLTRSCAVRASYSRGLHREDAQDVEAAARMGLWQAARTWSPLRGATFRGWALMRIRGAMLDWMRRACRMDSRKARRHGMDVPTVVSLDEKLPGDRAIEWPDLREMADRAEGERREEARARAEALIAAADRSDREVLGMRFLEGLTMASMGKRLHVSESRVSQRVAAALERLRAAIAGSCLSRRLTTGARRNAPPAGSAFARPGLQ